MRIVVMSDSHASDVGWLDGELIKDIKDADAVLHAGDIGTEEFYEELKNISKKLYAVKGNNDFFALPKQLVEDFEGIKLAMTHGDGFRSMDMHTYLTYLFADQHPDIIVYGHTHVPKMIRSNKVVIMNPGSCTYNRGVNYNSYALLDIKNGNYEINYIKIK